MVERIMMTKKAHGVLEMIRTLVEGKTTPSVQFQRLMKLSKRDRRNFEASWVVKEVAADRTD